MRGDAGPRVQAAQAPDRSGDRTLETIGHVTTCAPPTDVRFPTTTNSRWSATANGVRRTQAAAMAAPPASTSPRSTPPSATLVGDPGRVRRLRGPARQDSSVYQHRAGRSLGRAGEGADMSELARRAEAYAAPAPDWVLFITCGADVQKDRIEATKWGWGLNEVSGVIEHRIFYGDVLKQPEVWAEFESWRATEYCHRVHRPRPAHRLHLRRRRRRQPRRRRPRLHPAPSEVQGLRVEGRIHHRRAAGIRGQAARPTEGPAGAGGTVDGQRHPFRPLRHP